MRVMIIAGEPSGDMHAAALMRALQAKLDSKVEFRGIGGDLMKAAGAELLYHTDQTAVIGLWDVLRHLGFFKSMLRQMERELKQWKPDVLLTVDYPGFNLRLAAKAHKLGIKTIHYICPQIWAWHRSRVSKIARILDGLITLFHFEPECFAATDLKVFFAGHPLVDRAHENLMIPEQPLPWGKARFRIALLPGSRQGEITRILPTMLAAGNKLECSLAEKCIFMIPAASPAMRQIIEKMLASTNDRPKRVVVVDGQAREVMRQSHVATIASGTATLEASLMRCPTILVYRVPWLTYVLAKRLITGVKYLGLANIIADREVMPELLQYDFTPDNLADNLRALLTDENRRTTMLNDFAEVNAALGERGASERAADAFVEILKVSR
jgi:lipid-A-disaccharide synthase